MKKRIIGLIAVQTSLGVAQEPAATVVPVTADATTDRPPEAPPDLLVMKTPSSPAFVALGVSPTEIQRPTTPSTIAVDVLSRLTRENGSVTIPQGLALEVAPYWLTPRYDLTFGEYANEGLESAYRSATVSVATAPSSPAAAPPPDPAEPALPTPSGTDVAVGLRSTILHPSLSAEQELCVARITKALSVAAEAESAVVDAEMRKWADAEWEKKHAGEAPPTSDRRPKVPEAPDPMPAMPTPPRRDDPSFDPKFRQFELDLADYERRSQQLEAHENGKRQLSAWAQAREEYQSLVTDKGQQTRLRSELESKARDDKAAKLEAELEPCLRSIQAYAQGVSIDVAGALAWTFPGTTFDQGDLRRALAWGTLAYASDNLTLLGLVRYVGEDDSQGKRQHGYDLGFRLIYAADRWGLSGELVRRKIDSSASRYDIGFDYRVAGETWVHATFGKDYGVGDAGALIATVNLHLGFGDQELKPIREQIKEPGSKTSASAPAGTPLTAPTALALAPVPRVTPDR